MRTVVSYVGRIGRSFWKLEIIIDHKKNENNDSPKMGGGGGGGGCDPQRHSKG